MEYFLAIKFFCLYHLRYCSFLHLCNHFRWHVTTLATCGGDWGTVNASYSLLAKFFLSDLSEVRAVVVVVVVVVNLYLYTENHQLSLSLKTRTNYNCFT